METLYLKKIKGAFFSGIVSEGVRYYRDGEGKQLLCTNPWPDRPTKRNKYVVYNCQKYLIQWIEE